LIHKILQATMKGVMLYKQESDMGAPMLCHRYGHV